MYRNRSAQVRVIEPEVQLPQEKKPMTLGVLGVDCNMLVIGKFRQGTGDAATAHRIRQYFDFSDQNWSAKDISSFPDKESFLNFIIENRFHCVIGIHALICAKLLLDCPLPYAIIFSGSDLMECSQIPEYLHMLTVAVHNAEAVISYSSLILSEVTKLWPHMPSEKIRQINQAVFTRPAPKLSLTWMEKTHLGPDSLIFLMVTKLEEHKDPLHIIPTFTHWHQMHDRHPFLIIVGYKTRLDAEYIRRLTATIDGCPGVLYIGSRKFRETHRLIADSFALVNCSPAMETCTAILEAMDLGVPVLARESVCHSALIDDERTGLIYRSPEDFVEKAELLLNDYEFRQKLIVNAKQSILKNHNMNEEKEAYSKLARNLKKAYVPIVRKNDGKWCPDNNAVTSDENKVEDNKTKVRFSLPNDPSRPANNSTTTTPREFDNISQTQLTRDGNSKNGNRNEIIVTCDENGQPVPQQNDESVHEAFAEDGTKIPRWKLRKLGIDPTHGRGVARMAGIGTAGANGEIQDLSPPANPATGSMLGNPHDPQPQLEFFIGDVLPSANRDLPPLTREASQMNLQAAPQKKKLAMSISLPATGGSHLMRESTAPITIKELTKSSSESGVISTDMTLKEMTQSMASLCRQSTSSMAERRETGAEKSSSNKKSKGIASKTKSLLSLRLRPISRQRMAAPDDVTASAPSTSRTKLRDEHIRTPSGKKHHATDSHRNG